jgi:hypothetical protein
MLVFVVYGNGIGKDNIHMARVSESDDGTLTYQFADGRTHHGSQQEFASCCKKLDDIDLEDKKVYGNVFLRDIDNIVKFATPHVCPHSSSIAILVLC